MGVVTWDVEAQRLFGPVNKQLSCYNYFCLYVEDHKAFPTINQFILYVRDKQLNKLENPFDTLHTFIFDSVKALFNSYYQVLGEDFKDASVETFIINSRKSMDQTRRSQLDGTDSL